MPTSMCLTHTAMLSPILFQHSQLGGVAAPCFLLLHTRDPKAFLRPRKLHLSES